MVGLSRIINRFRKRPVIDPASQLIEEYLSTGRIPWSRGYWQYKMKLIKELISDNARLDYFRSGKLPENFGCGIDERLVEYGWFFAHLKSGSNTILDAGSTLNFPEFVTHPVIRNKKLYVQTLAPEKIYYNNEGISYVYDDLRDIPFRNDYFDTVVSISTIEHIGMDNEIFGVEHGNIKNNQVKGYDYIKACQEMLRVCKPGGELFITFPFGKWKSYGFYQQFDEEMESKLVDGLTAKAALVSDVYFQYSAEGWMFSTADKLKDSLSFNPHTGEDKGNDGAAHCRGVCCLHFRKL